MRIILYTGKGGVGKTSVAADTALRAAELGHRTIVLSTDLAHSLADSFDTKLSGTPTPIAPNLWGQEVDIYEEIKTHWGTIEAWVSAVMTWRGLDQIVADEMAVLPGMDELSSLLQIITHYDSGQYDVIIVDCAPTGDTLRLLSFPEIARWWMERMFPIERQAARLLRPVFKPLLGLPFPGDEVFDAIQQLFQQLARMRTLLTDPEKSSVRLVVNPEKMVIKETQRTFTHLNLYGYATDLIVCNRLLPDRVHDAYFDGWKRQQASYFEMIEEDFAPLPIRSVPLLEQEVVGKEMLRAMAEALFGKEDPAQVFYHGRVHEIEKADGSYILAIPLPFVTKEEISLARSGDELVVQAGRFKRNILLPRALVGLEVRGAKFEGDRLKIRFEGKDERARAE